MEIVSADVPHLQLCLDPRPPRVFSARRAPRASNGPVEPAPRTSQGNNPRFKRTAIAPNFGEVEPGEIPYRSRPNTTSDMKKLSEQSMFMSRIKADEGFISGMEAKLQAYANCAEMKKIVHEQDYIDHFYRPLQYRIKDEMTPRKYRALTARKSRAIQKMDDNPIPIRSNRKLPKVPCVSVNQKGLKDPTYRYIQHREKERRLEEFIARSNGVPITVTKTPKKMLDYAQYDVERHTRFFYGRTEEADRVGRKCFEQHNASKVDRATDMFGGPLP